IPIHLAIRKPRTPCIEDLWRNRASQVEALPVIATLLLQKGHMGSRFHPLRNDLESEGARHRYGCTDNRAIPRITIYPLDEGLVDLQAINREILEVGQGTV